jgi:catechol 2,3-dioxygenase-like lactoylglutathione lyase family enzyme
MLKSMMYMTVYVSDQDRALEFYTGGLGLRKRIDAQGPGGRFLTVAPGDEPVEILLWPTAAAPQGSTTGPVAGPVRSGVAPGSVFLESDDLAADFELFRSRGVGFVQEAPTPYPFGVLLTALDPDGNRIELRQRRTAGSGEG